MANLLIAATSERYRSALARLLRAAGRHVVATSDAALARAALCLNEHPLIVLLADADPVERSMLDVAVVATEAPSDPDDPERACILLTNRSRSQLPASVRKLLAMGAAAVLRQDCSIGSLLTAVEDANEYLAEHAEAPEWRTPCAVSG